MPNKKTVSLYAEGWFLIPATMVFKNDDEFPHHLEIDANESVIGSDELGSVSPLKHWVQRSCTTELLKRRFPFLQWAPSYTFRSIFHDAIAGFTVALTAIPQGIAYGAVAGLPVEVTSVENNLRWFYNIILKLLQYGLYTAFAGPFIYALLGSVRQITVGPTAVMAIMTHEYTVKGGAPYAIVLSFLAGCLELLAGLFNFGEILLRVKLSP